MILILMRKKDSFSYQNFEGAFQRLIELLRSIGNINKSRIDDQRKKKLNKVFMKTGNIILL